MEYWSLKALKVVLETLRDLGGDIDTVGAFALKEEVMKRGLTKEESLKALRYAEDKKWVVFDTFETMGSVGREILRYRLTADGLDRLDRGFLTK